MITIKKLWGIAACALVLAACDKESPTDAFGNPEDPYNPVISYMTAIADNLVCDNLRELESALKVSASGGLGKYFYDTNDKALTDDGASWTVKKECNVTGLKIEKVSGVAAWKMTYSGKYSFSNNEYDTAITINAEQEDPTATGHQSWNVTIEGTRTEEEGYSCAYTTDGTPIQYKSFGEGTYWNAYGYLMMTVFKDGTQIDKVVMELAGGKSDSSMVRL